MLAQQRGQYVANFVRLGRKQVALGKNGSPRAFVIPATQRDPSAVRRLVEVLTVGGVDPRRDRRLVFRQHIVIRKIAGEVRHEPRNPRSKDQKEHGANPK